jgi:hypothetical protein
MLLTCIAGLLAYLWSQDDKVAPLLIFFGLPTIWILLSMHATRLQTTGRRSAQNAQ